jgi:hypothetical protein
MRQKANRCLAYRETSIQVAGRKRIVYLPCGLPKLESRTRFCRYHAKAYRELLLGIIVDGSECHRKQNGGYVFSESKLYKAINLMELQAIKCEKASQGAKVLKDKSYYAGAADALRTAYSLLRAIK